MQLVIRSQSCMQNLHLYWCYKVNLVLLLQFLTITNNTVLTNAIMGVTEHINYDVFSNC